ncbi:hypothetical protein M3221_10665 [Domibacillus indicus]|nr:hypothetical protein [Domibacillus indicus]
MTQADIDRGYVEVILTDKSLGERLLVGLLYSVKGHGSLFYVSIRFLTFLWEKS